MKNLKVIIYIVLLLCQITVSGQITNFFTYPKFDISITPQEPRICPGQTISISCNGEFISYQWDGVGFDFQAFGKSVELTEIGEYTLTIESKVNGIVCSDEIIFQTIIDDSDNDGICDDDDCFPLIPIVGVGLICDDFNPCTINDIFDENCNCSGTIIPNCIECLEDSPCDDANSCTRNDRFDNDCNCIGEYIPDCDPVNCLLSGLCNDGNPCTENDTFDENCNCIGTPILNCIECQDGLCDDGNPCTENDTFDENCNCIGIPNLEFTINISGSDPCYSDFIQILEIQEEFQKYSWYHNNELIGSDKILETYVDGEIEVVVTEGNCDHSQTIILTNPLQNDFELQASDLKICDIEVPVVLEVSDTFEEIEWKNSDESIISTSNRIEVIDADTYTVTALDPNGCFKQNEITITSPLQDIILKPEEAMICSALDGVSVGLENLPDNIESIIWSTGDIGVEEIIVYAKGEYEVEVMDLDGCGWRKTFEVTSNTAEDIISDLEENGFESIPVDFIISLKGKVNTGNVRTEACILDNKQNGLKNHKVLITELQEEVLIFDYMQALLDEACSCYSDVGALVMDDFCIDSEYTRDFFNTFDEKFNDGVIQVFLNPDFDPSNIWIKNTVKEQCLTQFKPNPNSFSLLINEILCAKNHQDNLKVDFNPTPSASVKSDELWSGRLPQFDLNKYNGIYGNGINIQNIKHDAILNLSDESAITYEYIPEFCIYSIALQSELTYGNGPFLQISIEYSDFDCPLKITVPNNSENANFIKLFQNTQDLVDETINSYSLSLNKEEIENIPSCYVSNTQMCELLESFKYGPNKTKAFLNLTNERFMEQSSIPQRSNSIITCIDENKLIYPYTLGGFSDPKSKISLFGRLTQLYYNLGQNSANTTEDFNFYLGGTRFFKIGSNYNNTYTSDGLNSTFTEKKYVYTIAGLLPQSTSSSKDFDYFNNYTVRVESNFNFLSDISDKFENEYVDLNVPGVYVAYVVESFNKLENSEDISVAGDIVTMAVGYGALSAAIKANRLQSLRAVFAAADITSGTLGIFLHESTLCEGTGLPAGFCKEYGEVIDIANMVLLTGTFIPSQAAKVKSVSTDWNNLPSAPKQTLLDKLDEIHGQGAGKLIDDFLKSGGDMEGFLIKTFQDIYDEFLPKSQLLFKELSEIKDVNKLIELENVIKTDLTTEKAHTLFQDINSTKQYTDKIGGSLDGLNTGMIKAWDFAFTCKNCRVITGKLENIDGFKSLTSNSEAAVKYAKKKFELRSSNKKLKMIDEEFSNPITDGNKKLYGKYEPHEVTQTLKVMDRVEANSSFQPNSEVGIEGLLYKSNGDYIPISLKRFDQTTQPSQVVSKIKTNAGKIQNNMSEFADAVKLGNPNTILDVELPLITKPDMLSHLNANPGTLNLPTKTFKEIVIGCSDEGIIKIDELGNIIN